MQGGCRCCSFLPPAGFPPQKSTLNEDLVKADRQFALYAYNLAMQTYQQVLKEDPRNAHALARIGDCYFQLNTPAKSLEWYQKAIRQYNMEADVHLRYGKALMQTGDYSGAKDQFNAYAEADEAVGRKKGLDILVLFLQAYLYHKAFS